MATRKENYKSRVGKSRERKGIKVNRNAQGFQEGIRRHFEKDPYKKCMCEVCRKYRK